MYVKGSDLHRKIFNGFPAEGNGYRVRVPCLHGMRFDPNLPSYLLEKRRWKVSRVKQSEKVPMKQVADRKDENGYRSRHSSRNSPSRNFPRAPVCSAK